VWRIDERTRPWWTLAGACFGLFILMLDSTVVALALPSIRHDVGATATGLQWVMNGYLLTIAVLVVTAGRLGDMFGRKRVFLGGVLAMDRVLAGAVALAATGAVFHALQGGGSSFAVALAGSTWVPAALCALGAILTWAFVRDPEKPGPDPAVAGEPPPAELHHHRHHRRFHL
jgi:MFS family permease